MPARKVTNLGLSPESVRKTLNQLARDSGNVFFTTHAEQRMVQRKLAELKCFAVFELDTSWKAPRLVVKAIGK